MTRSFIPAITSASFSSTNIDAYYLILAWKADEHIDFNFTVDANEHRNGDTVHSLISRRVQALSGGTSQCIRHRFYTSGFIHRHKRVLKCLRGLVTRSPTPLACVESTLK